jgi:plastocyanin
VALEIKIQGDTQGSQFEPRLGQVRTGTTVKWVNVDSQARSVEADNGAFRSPSIPPGGSYELRAPAPGTYNYHDGTRPYAVAQLQVV